MLLVALGQLQHLVPQPGRIDPHRLGGARVRVRVRVRVRAS